VIHFFTKSLLIDIVPETKTPAPSIYKSIDNLTHCSPKTQGANNSGLLLTSLYLQKMTKYLHLVNVSDLNLDHTLNLNTNFLTLYKIFQGELKDLNFMLFFSSNNKFNLKSINSNTFSSKESLFYKCVEEEKLLNSHSYILNANMLKSLPFVFQKEFNTVIKRNLTLGKENK
jgi:hypothetical protein